MTYTVEDFERDLAARLERVELELQRLEGDSAVGTKADAEWRADKRHELRSQARQLENSLLEFRMEYPEAAEAEALRRQKRRLEEPARDPAGEKRDKLVRDALKKRNLGLDQYIPVARQLSEWGDLD